MSNNLSTASLPLLLPFKDSINTIQINANNHGAFSIPITEAPSTNSGITIIPPLNTIEPRPLLQQDNPLQPCVTLDISTIDVEESSNIIYKVVYPEDLDLKIQKNVKRGRPKRKKTEKPPIDTIPEPPPTARTRSGRLVKLPKHIEKHFNKIEITDEPELKTTQFVRFEDCAKENTKKLSELELHQRKRTISAQYRCPKCKKAYLGKNKMIQHLQKYPDHGNLPEKRNINFDVWNYLVDITQKCSPNRRGDKFCEELTNLLHNVQLLTSALFRQQESENSVNVDKVLGNAIGLNPGKYKFDENELYKDVTVLKLITNKDFFNPTNGISFKQTETVKSVTVVESPKPIEAKTKEKSTESSFFHTPLDFRTDSILEDEFNYSNSDNLYIGFNEKKTITTEEMHALVTFNKDHTSEDSYSKKSDEILDNRLSIHSDLLSDNSLLGSLPHLRTVDDELILSHVDTSSNLMDNSVSSDEVMNVDQFVNERFKKITEPDIELSGTSLNLDLPSLELFQFHTR